MRALTMLVLLLIACEASEQAVDAAHFPGRDGFDPIGRLADAGELVFVDAEPPPPDAAPRDSTPPPDARPEPPPPLALEFVELEQDSGAYRLTDLVFLPEPAGDFLVLDQDGEVIHMRLHPAFADRPDRAERLGGFTIDDVWTETDAGLISVALDPDFAENRFVYLGMSTSRETNVIRRYRWDPDDLAATKASQTLIFEVTGEGAPRSWHNVGSIGFTEAGHLWALFGDKVLDRFARDPHSPLGKLIRIIPSRDPESGGYTVPPDNPFADGSGHPAVYAVGLRSPWKGVYRDGRWIFGDVGLDAYEEINVVTGPAQDFGWPAAEGPCEADCAGLLDPWFHWGRSTREPLVAENPDATSHGKRSAWVGWAYAPHPDDPYDGRWDGVVTFGDAYVGSVRAAPATGEGESWHAGHLPLVTGWAQAPDGYVYVTTLGTLPRQDPTHLSTIRRAVLAD